MNRYQETLTKVLRPRFDELSEHCVSAVLVHHSGDLSRQQALESCPYTSSNDRAFGGVYGRTFDSPSQCTWRLNVLKGENDSALRQFDSLASDAGNCIGPWCETLLPVETITTRRSRTRWLYTLFDIAWSNHPGFPMEARRSEIENIRVFELQSKAQYGQVSAEDVESLRQEVAHLASLGFYSRLEDVIRASVYAIDILATVEQPDSQVDEPPSPTYPNPGTYARDMWIYDSIHRFSCDTLSRKLKEKAKAERWTIISSRNGFKKAADRYADFHKLERRRFKAD